MSKCHVLFIIPPNIPIKGFITEDPSANLGTTRSMPIGVLSIAAYVGEKADVDFTMLDLNLELIDYIEAGNKVDWEAFLQSFLRKLNLGKRIDIIGISALFNSSLGYISSIAASAKELWPESLLVAGGGAPTNLSAYVFDHAPAVDAILVGEGEKPFLGLVQATDRQAYLQQALGWTTRKRLCSGESSLRVFIDNLDEIPLLPYDLIAIDRYQKVTRFHGEKKPGTLAVSVMFSRGCPYKCNFCSAHTVHGRKLRYYSPARVLNDIRQLKVKYGANVIIIEDDLFFGQKKTALAILEELVKEGLEIEFTNGLSVKEMMDDEIVGALKAAGATRAQLAVESGSERVLREIIHKPFHSLSKVKAAVEVLRKKDLYVRAAFIIGFPGETKEEILESIAYMKEAGFNWVAVLIATPIAGSELYQFCKDNALLISDNPEDYHIGNCSIKLDHSTPEEIVELRYMINLEVNFVESYDLKHGRPDLALIGFESVIERSPNHAFAHYFSSICHRRLGDPDRAQKSLSRYLEIVKNSSYWAGYARHFGLPLPSEISSAYSYYER